jgi:hypothetical protein
MERSVMLGSFVWWALRLRLRARLREHRRARLLIESGVFDEDWYVGRNPDVVLAGLDPLRHWLLHGWQEGRAPNPLVDPALLSPCDTGSGTDPLDSLVAQIVTQYGKKSNSDLRKPQ